MSNSPKCPKCSRPMSWDSYTLSSRPDALRGADQRAPLGWAWHCWCGMWVYEIGRRGSPS